MVYLAAAVPLIFSALLLGRPAEDDAKYHEPTIRVFIEQWPAPDLADYRSATTPLYHLVLAGVGVAVDDSRLVLQLAASLWTVALLGLLGWTLAKRTSTAHAVALGLPFLCSLYVLPPGVWLLPDNAGWLLVLSVLLLALRPAYCPRTIVLGGAALLVLVLIRQSHLWAAAVLWAAAWLGPDADVSSRTVLSDVPRRIPRLLVMLAATLPAFAAVGYFVWLWGGLVPPTFQGLYTGRSPAAPAFILALFGFFAPFYAADIWPGLRSLWAERPAVLVAVVLGGALIAVVPASTYDMDAGRWTGLWNLVAKVPAPFGRSPVIVLPAVLGAVLLAGLLVRVDTRTRWIVLAALAAFAAAQSASPQLWQRYSEPLVLLLLALLAATPGRAEPAGRRSLFGPLLLALMLAALTTITLATSHHVTPPDGLATDTP